MDQQLIVSGKVFSYFISNIPQKIIVMYKIDIITILQYMSTRSVHRFVSTPKREPETVSVRGFVHSLNFCLESALVCVKTVIYNSAQKQCAAVLKHIFHTFLHVVSLCSKLRCKKYVALSDLYKNCYRQYYFYFILIEFF